MVIREGFHSVTPYLTNPNLDGLLDFMKSSFDAVETFRERGDSGGFHVEVRIGDSMVMVGGSPKSQTAMLYLYVDDPDASYKRALKAGATSIMEPADVPDGERRAGVSDPFGNSWFFGKPLARTA